MRGEHQDISTIGQSSSPPDFLTVEECAALLRLSRNSVYEAIRRGELPGVVRIGRRILISRQVLLESFGIRADRTTHT